jgi:hypothetical protein
MPPKSPELAGVIFMNNKLIMGIINIYPNSRRTSGSNWFYGSEDVLNQKEEDWCDGISSYATPIFDSVQEAENWVGENFAHDIQYNEYQRENGENTGEVIPWPSL